MTRLKRSAEKMSAWVEDREHASRDRRVIVRMPVVLEADSGLTIEALVADLSKSGFRLTSNAVLHVGQVLTMRLPRENVLCEICWVDGLESGGIFRGRANLPAW
jgi:PilZ domain-containing protein